jgi:hypothetical protein
MAAADQSAKAFSRATSMESAEQSWPALPLGEWEATYRTLHMWTQIVGKIRLILTPLQNHWWNAALYVSTRGLTTSPIPYRGRAFTIQFDFIHHRLEIQTPNGGEHVLALSAKSVAAFYRELFSALQKAGIEVRINTKPQEVADPIPFESDETHTSYDPEYANRFWRILRSTDLVFQEFRSRFLGKQSPVHFFWGSFDLAYTRFSGRGCAPRKGVITSEAYSRECSSIGWWPGGGEVAGPAFYAYSAPEPPGYAEQPVRPAGAFYQKKLHEYLLMYDDVRRATSPGNEILEFAQSVYEAGANAAGWDRAALERTPRS